MKKSLKGIVLASLISTQILAGPISALAVIAETTENSEQVEPQKTEEQTGEAVVPDATEENKKETAVDEAQNQEETPGATLTEETETPVTENASEVPITPAVETPVTPTASEEKMQAVREAIANAQTVLDNGTYTAETAIPLQAAMSAATALLSQTDVTDEQLDAAIADINGKVASLVKAEVELSFVGNLVMAINEATKIINNTDEFKDIYTPASVAAKKASIQTAVDAGKNVLAAVVDAQGKIVPEVAANNRDEIIAAAEAIIAAINNGNGLVRRDHLVEILQEASRLEGAKVASDSDKADFEAALKQVTNAMENALTDAEADAAVSALRVAMDNLRLVVVVSAVDEDGNLIMNQADTLLSGLYKTAWKAEPPVVEGYEYVSSNNDSVTFSRTSGQVVSGTFGDGTNDVTFVYRKSVARFEPPYVPAPKEPADKINQPDKLGITNNLVNNTKNNTYHSKKNLPRTGEETSSMASFGLMAVVASTLVFFKKRKIEE